MKFDISELAENAQQINLSVTAQQLTDFAQYLITESKKHAQEEAQSLNGEIFISGQQVMEMMSISKSTLNRMKKLNYLVPIRFGGNDRYKLSDIQRIINQETTAGI